MFHFTHALLGCALAGGFTQEPESFGPATQHGVGFHKTSELVMRHYRPSSADARELLSILQTFIGHELLLQDDATGSVQKQRNLQVLGDMVLIYDLPEGAERALQLARELDAESEIQEQDQEKARERVVVEYRPRFLDIDSIRDALVPFMQVGVGTVNISFMREPSIAVIHDTRGRVDQILEFLRRIDVESPQVLVTCYLVRGSDEEPEGPTLPAELVSGMRDLVGYPHLQREALGLIRASVNSNEVLTVLLQSKMQGTYELSMRPAAYDETRRSLTLAECVLRAQAATGHQSGTTLFSTQTTIVSDEYTVLGATGTAPFFVVLHTRPVAR